MDERVSRRALTPADGLIVAALSGLLFSIYLLTASLTFISDDEVFIFDTTESLAQHGNNWLGETADLRWPGESDVEPIMPLLAAPIHWLASRFDGIGNAHATLLFNPLITALTAGLVYLYVRQLALDRSTALASGLAFGLATLAWPYTKTFFREPVHTATIFATAYCLLRWRDAFVHKQASAGAWLALTLLAAIVSIFAKESALYVLPVLLLILVPDLSALRTSRHAWLGIGLALAVAVVLAGIGFWSYATYFVPGRFDIVNRLNMMVRHAGLAGPGMLGYLVSPGKSVFLFSPPLLLALAAPFIGDRRRRFEAGWPLILLAVSVIVYALVRGQMWWGGTNWGPRYMLPVTPFLIAGAASAIEAALHSRSRLWTLGIAIVCLGGILVQVGAVSVRIHDYYNWIGAIRPDGAWTVGLWEPYYSAVFSHWRLIGTHPPDFAWVQALESGPTWMLPALLVALSAVFAAAMGYGLTHESIKRRAVWSSALAGLVATGAATWLGLHAIYYDQRYQGNVPELHQLNTALEERTANAPDPVIFLNNRTYFRFFLNYYKGPLNWYTLELNPNDLLPPGQGLPARSIDPQTLVNEDALGVVDCFGRDHNSGDPVCSARDHQTAFLVMEFGPFTPQSPRPLEWWMSRRFHYKEVWEAGPTVRLVQFSTNVIAPAPADPPAHPTAYRFGDSVELTGWNAYPDGTPLRPGGVLDISTQWKAVGPLAADFKIGMYLITPEGAVAAQDDSFPANGFWPTSTWRPGDLVRHNIALSLPGDLPPGFYEVWTVMYAPPDGPRLQVQESNGTTIRDHVQLFSVEVTR